MVIKNDKHSSNLNDLKQKVSKELENLKGLPDEAKKSKNEDIKQMIRYYNGLTDKIEDRRNRIHNFGLQLLAISITGLILVISQSASIQGMDLGNQFILEVVVIILAALIISSLISSIFFQMQSRFRYPFLHSSLQEYGNKWKWFYYGNKEILKIDTNPFFNPRGAEQALRHYLNGLSNFILNYREENLDKKVTNNIQQLYLLLVHNYFKNRFYLQLTNIWKISFIIIFIIVVFSTIIFLKGGF